MTRNKHEHTASLTERMEAIAKQFDGIWSITEDKLSNLKDAIEIHSQKEEHHDNIIAKTR